MDTHEDILFQAPNTSLQQAHFLFQQLHHSLRDLLNETSSYVNWAQVRKHAGDKQAYKGFRVIAVADIIRLKKIYTIRQTTGNNLSAHI